MKQYIKITFKLLFSISLLTSCDDLLEVDPEEVLLAEDYLGDDDSDARSALFGVLGEMQDLTEQYLVLGEMRADLVDFNENTVDDIIQISNHNVDNDNPYIDPVRLFSIINNCNYTIDNIDNDANEGRLLKNTASMIRIRTWAQMQLLIHYGKLPYIVTAIDKIEDFTEEGKYEVYNFDEGLQKLIEILESIASIDNVDTDTYSNSLGYSVSSMIPDKNILLGDLYLWEGDYTSAALRYKKFLDNEGFPEYKMNSSYDIEVLDSDGEIHEDEAWGDIFDGESLKTDEIINFIAYSEQFRQKNTGFDIVSNQFAASDLIKLEWDKQFLIDDGNLVDNPGDVRSRLSFDEENPEKIRKYNEEYFSWTRAAKVYLRYAEAINRLGFSDRALEIVNGFYFDTNPDSALIFAENNIDRPFSPFAFEKQDYFTLVVRGTEIDITKPGFLGVRGRAGLSKVSFVVPNDENNDGIDDSTGDPVAKLTAQEKMRQAEDFIINEAALELAFEGNRWEDLLRISRRRNDRNYIADKVAAKFELKGDIGKANDIRTKLSTIDGDNGRDYLYFDIEIPSNFTIVGEDDSVDNETVE